MRVDPFPTLGTKEMIELIEEARLGRVNTKIAKMALIDKESDADIAAAFSKHDGCSRSSIGRRLRDTIIPALKTHLSL